MKKLVLLAAAAAACLSLAGPAAAASLNASVGGVNHASLKDGETLTVNVIGPATLNTRMVDNSGKVVTVAVPACVDVGLYVNPGTTGAGGSNVDIKAADYSVFSKFQGGNDYGNTAVAHLFTASRTVTIVAHGNKGTFDVVPHLFPCSNLERSARGQTKTTQ